MDLVRDTTSPKPIARAPLDEQRAKAKLHEELRLRATAMALPLIFCAYEKARLAPQASPEEKYQRQRTSARVRRVIDDLVDPTEKAVLVRHYFGEESFVKIADALGLSKWQACRLHKRALERVAAALHQ